VGRLLWGIRVEGRENIPRSGPLLITSNHLSLLDPPLLGATIPREAGFVAKRELFAVPGLGGLIRSLNAMPLDRSRLSREEIRRFGQCLERGLCLVLFPEGTRSRDGTLGKGKIGVGLLLAERPVAILPTIVEGTDSPIRNLFRRGRVRVVFGRPYTLPKREPGARKGREDYRRIADSVMDEIRQLRDAERTLDGGRASRP
jgi:1-acyl-sn-glycerol-3-phosphate acyltransferase